MAAIRTSNENVLNIQCKYLPSYPVLPQKQLNDPEVFRHSPLTHGCLSHSLTLISQCVPSQSENILTECDIFLYNNRLCTNPLARSPGQVKLDSDK